MSSIRNTRINVGCITWPSSFLTVAIIAVRAFQTNAEPMSSWSVLSWFLMLLPVTFPVLLWIAIGVAALIAAAFSKN